MVGVVDVHRHSPPMSTLSTIMRFCSLRHSRLRAREDFPHSCTSSATGVADTDRALRRDELRIEMTAGRPFLQPGDVVTATLADSRGLSLGGLANKIVEARHRG
jgi:hypothetical protein